MVVLACDLFIIMVAWYIAICLRLNTIWSEIWLQSSIPLLIWLLISGIALAFVLRLNYVKLGGFEVYDLGRVLAWVVLLTFFGTAANIFLDLGAPRTVPIIFGPIVLSLMLMLRLSAVIFLKWIGSGYGKLTPIAIYGAGEQGSQLVTSLRNSREYRPVVLLDDNKTLYSTIISGLRIQSPDVIKKYLKLGRIKKVIFATDSIPDSKKYKLLQQLKEYDCEALEFPSYADMIKTGGLAKSLRSVQAEELLGRDGVDLKGLDVIKAYSGFNVFVSGAGGSIGSELCRQLIEINPNSIILFEMSEFALYAIENELAPLAEANGINIIAVLGSVCDEEHLNQLFKKYCIDVIIHAAAYKHVPLIESNELEGVRNNVIGTNTIAGVAARFKVKRFIQISTDKAVRPTNIMGASKRMAEMIIQNHGENTEDSIFSIVRFGNVLGSSGSVIPLFKKQISNGGPITVTDKDVIRYFMTISEAARLVLLAGSYAYGGEVFVLDMGKPIKIYDMARQIVKLSGLTVRDDDNPNGDIEIKFTGLRPGEKLYEELLIDENTLETLHPKILRAKEKKLTEKQLATAIEAIDKAINDRKSESIRGLMHKWVNEYKV